MERYYYHGIESYLDEEASMLETMLTIIKSGAIKTFNNLNGTNSEGMNHICLFKKNDSFDYEHREPYPMGPMSSLDAWIGNGVVFVISPDIDAYQAKYTSNYRREEGTTNIIDEWRTNSDIPLEKIVGIALPLDTIKEEMETSKVWGEKLNQLLEIAKQYGWFIVNSEDVAFTDKLDSQLSNKKHQLD